MGREAIGIYLSYEPEEQASLVHLVQDGGKPRVLMKEKGTLRRLARLFNLDLDVVVTIDQTFLRFPSLDFGNRSTSIPKALISELIPHHGLTYDYYPIKTRRHSQTFRFVAVKSSIEEPYLQRHIVRLADSGIMPKVITPAVESLSMLVPPNRASVLLYQGQHEKQIMIFNGYTYTFANIIRLGKCAAYNAIVEACESNIRWYRANINSHFRPKTIHCVALNDADVGKFCDKRIICEKLRYPGICLAEMRTYALALGAALIALSNERKINFIGKTAREYK